MPVKWTPDNDQTLLLKILETHELAVDAKKVAAAWPTDQGEAPTPRAISERLVKIRANARKNGGDFKVASVGRSHSNTTNSGSPAGPRAGRIGNKLRASRPAKGAMREDVEENTDSDVTVTPSKRKHNGTGGMSNVAKIKLEAAEDSDSEDIGEALVASRGQAPKTPTNSGRSFRMPSNPFSQPFDATSSSATPTATPSSRLERLSVAADEDSPSKRTKQHHVKQEPIAIEDEFPMLREGILTNDGAMEYEI